MFIKRYLPIFLLCISANVISLRADSLPLPVDAQYWCTVGDAGNAADSDTKLGAVDTSYQIGKYEVTAGEYSAFLTAVASHQDPHELYNPNMESITRGDAVLPDGTTMHFYFAANAAMPANGISCYSAMRYCNWLQNGLPTGADGDDVVAVSTESGAYNFSNINGVDVVTFSEHAIYALPTENQWFKAAYYNGHGLSSAYWNYPTKSLMAPCSPNSWLIDPDNIANWNRQNDLTPVNQFPKTASSYNVSDLAGNVAEWIVRTTPPEGALTVAVRGGSHESPYYEFCHNDLQKTAIVKNIDPFTESSAVGFRLVHLNPAADSSTHSSKSLSCNEHAPLLQATAPLAKTSTVSLKKSANDDTAFSKKFVNGFLTYTIAASMGIVAAIILVPAIELVGGACILDAGTTAVADAITGITGWEEIDLTPQAIAQAVGATAGMVTQFFTHFLPSP